MADTLVNVLVVVLFAAGFFWSVLYVRRQFGALPRLDPEDHYRLARRRLIIFGLLLMAMVAATLGDQHKSLSQRIWLPILFSIAFGSFLFQFLRARKKYRELPEWERRGRKPKAPTFFWQGLMIVLPVVLMAGFGFWGILHQRRAVEQDAQARAQDILHGLPDEFGRMVANELTEYDARKNGWLSFLENGAARWPADKLRRSYVGDTNVFTAVSNSLAMLRAAFPGWTDGVPPLATFILETNGEPAWQQSLPPRPPEWLPAMTAEQRAAWLAMQSADLGGEPVSNLVAFAAAFKQTDPPAPAKVWANFIVLRAQVRQTPATNAVARLLNFARAHDDAQSDSGVEVSSLALAEALVRSRECGPSEQLWDALDLESCRAGALAPKLLDEAAPLAKGDEQLTESIAAMKVCLAERQLRRDLADALALGGYSTRTMTTNFWINARNARWFCLIQPNEIRTGTIVSNQPVWETNFMPEARAYSQTAVVHSLVSALQNAKFSLPPYFEVSCEMAGEPLTPSWSWSAGGESAADVFAEAHFRMNQPAMMAGRPNETFEDMPSHPEFTLQIRLVDRHLLYARQQQLQLIFGSLIALAALSAVVGYAAAWRAFRRQLQLNEQKSNFVSSVSHELRAPIASVRLMAENLERGKVSEPGKQGEYFRFIVQECRRLSSLIENVLDSARIEQGRKQYEFEPTNLVALVETTVKLMEPYANERGVILKGETFNIQHSTLNIQGEASSITSRPGVGNLELNMDGRAIQQALVNLIDNAVKHSAKGETVTVGIEMQNEELRMKNGGAGSVNDRPSAISLYVADQGPGIPAAEREKIFERFYRLGSELRRQTQGVGIGLSVVKHIVEAHGGRVRVESEAGKGSRFVIELPIGK